VFTLVMEDAYQKKEKYSKKGKPRIVEACFYWLERRIKPYWKVFEWGAGRSTIYWGQKIAEVVSVEHVEGWRVRIVRALKKNQLNNVIFHFILPDDLPSKQHMEHMKRGAIFKLIQDPTKYLSKHYKTSSFKSYVKIIDAYPDGYFNLIFIDGRARPSCIKHAISKIRPGGYLMLDNSERLHYELAKQLVEDWNEISFYPPGRPPGKRTWTTTVWTKPNL